MQRRILRESEIEVWTYESLSASEQQLVQAAHKSREQAYAPYSNFLVGAALELDNRIILTGNNQENAAYPSGLCAERVVLFFAGANYPNSAPVRMAIIAKPRGGAELQEPATPCGGCLQALWQYEQRFVTQLEVLLVGSTEVWKIKGIQQCLPFAFKSLER